MADQATVLCSCGSDRWAVESPVTDASRITCEACGAVTTMGEAKREAARVYARKRLTDSLGGADGLSIEE